MLRALAFCARAYVKFKSSGTVFDSRKFIQSPPYFILALRLHIYVALIKWWSVCYSSEWKVYDTINDHILACKWSSYI